MLLPNDFYSMSPYHFSLMIKGHQEKKVDLYRQTRLLMFTMVKLHGDPKTSPKSPESLWQLPGDSDEFNELNDDDIKEIFKRLA
jgi:hypothetical protein